MSKKNLLISEPPLQVLPSLAVAIGLNEAIVVQQLHYWTQNQNAKGEVDPAGNKWIFNTYDEWKETNFPFWSAATIQRVFLNLEDMGIVVSAQLNATKRDMRKYYRLDYETLDRINLGRSHHSKLGRSKTPHCDDVKGKSETTTETTSENINKQALELFKGCFGKFNSEKELVRWNDLFQAVGWERAEQLTEWALKKEIHLENRSGLLDSLETAAKNWREKTIVRTGKPKADLNSIFDDLREKVNNGQI